MRPAVLIAALLLVLSRVQAQQLPEIPPGQEVRFSTEGSLMLVLKRAEAEETSVPQNLAGIEFYPSQFSRVRDTTFQAVSIVNTLTGEESVISGLPDNARLSHITFSPDERKLAFINIRNGGVELWVSDLNTKRAASLDQIRVNDVLGTPYTWHPGSSSLLVKTVVTDKPPAATTGTKLILENNQTPNPSNQNRHVLRNAAEDAQFDHYFSAQLKLAGVSGTVRDIGPPAIYRSFEYSPDGKFLLIATIDKPFSRLVPVEHLAYKTQVVTDEFKAVKTLYSAPAAENLPAGYDAVAKGPRRYGWRADKGSVLYWVEAQDNGDPSRQATIRDIVYTLAAPFNSNPYRLADCYYRFHSINWADDRLAIITERWWRTRAERRVFVKPANETFRVNLYDRYYENHYDDPGEFLTKKNEYHRQVLLTEFNPLRRLNDPDNVHLFSVAPGGTDAGDIPYLLRFNIKTKIRDTIFRSSREAFEKPVFFNNEQFVITRRETPESAAQYFRLHLRDSVRTKVGEVLNYPAGNLLQRRMLSFTRLDGLRVNAVAYLPKNFKAGDPPLPVLVWLQPKQYKTQAASQVKGSPLEFPDANRFPAMSWTRSGYVVIDFTDMPIFGESNQFPNDNYIEQIRYNAEALIQHLSATGLGDAKRVVVGGYRFGAHAAASLVAHTELFAAAVVLEGIYDSHRYPFGFLNDERNLWQIPALYNRLSVLNYANNFHSPILLIHKESDNETLEQGENLFYALRGLGKRAKLIVLPGTGSLDERQAVINSFQDVNAWLEEFK